MCVELCYWFLFDKDKLLLRKEGDRYSVPFSADSPMKVDHSLCVPFADGTEAKAASVDSSDFMDEGYEWIGLRASWNVLTTAEYKMAGKAFQMVHWDRNSRFCPACGRPMAQNTVMSKYCSNCKQEVYPRISPAIIVLIRRGEEILLVHARNFKGSFYGLVAGFLEVGETLEECVRREVCEETGLEIENIQYFDSQPWPYPSGIMIGFFADYKSGEIRLQDDELSAGRFFTIDNLPELPQKLSIARRMIERWRGMRIEGVNLKTQK